MKAEGDDFDKPRDMVFTVVFETNAAADRFATGFRELGHGLSVNQLGSVPDLPWDSLVVKFTLPSNHGISKFEGELHYRLFH